MKLKHNQFITLGVKDTDGTIHLYSYDNVYGISKDEYGFFDEVSVFPYNTFSTIDNLRGMEPIHIVVEADKLPIKTLRSSSRGGSNYYGVNLKLVGEVENIYSYLYNDIINNQIIMLKPNSIYWNIYTWVITLFPAVDENELEYKRKIIEEISERLGETIKIRIMSETYDDFVNLRYKLSESSARWTLDRVKMIEEIEDEDELLYWANESKYNYSRILMAKGFNLSIYYKMKATGLNVSSSIGYAEAFRILNKIGAPRILIIGDMIESLHSTGLMLDEDYEPSTYTYADHYCCYDCDGYYLSDEDYEEQIDDEQFESLLRIYNETRNLITDEEWSIIIESIPSGIIKRLKSEYVNEFLSDL